MSTTRTPEAVLGGRDEAGYEERVAAALRVIATTREDDFDGHTEFYRLTPVERLAWMESAVCLIESRRKVTRSG